MLFPSLVSWITYLCTSMLLTVDGSDGVEITHADPPTSAVDIFVLEAATVNAQLTKEIKMPRNS